MEPKKRNKLVNMIKRKRSMTALEMNAELFSELSVIARNEAMMEKLLKYAKKLTSKKSDPTLMTKEEFFARIDRAKEGSTMRFNNAAEVEQYIRSL